jgi:hypothetical protein
MFGKRTRFLTMMAAALGVPYAWFNENFSSSVHGTLTSLQTSVSTLTKRSSQHNTNSGLSDQPITALVSENMPKSAKPTASIHQLVDVLRFDVTPRWVIDQWGRVSTVHAEENLEGLRVPLVTGINPDDIAGSLTYYFDAQHRVRRIRLHGVTGDERTLVAIGTKHFGLRAEPSLGAGTYINRWNATPMNVLRIMHAPVVRADALNSRLIVDLELNDVQAGYGMSAEFTQLLQADRSIGRGV